MREVGRVNLKAASSLNCDNDTSSRVRDSLQKFAVRIRILLNPIKMNSHVEKRPLRLGKNLISLNLHFQPTQTLGFRRSIRTGYVIERENRP